MLQLDAGGLFERELRKMRDRARAGRATEEVNPNGSLRNIAGIVNASRNVFGTSRRFTASSLVMIRL